MGQMLQDRIKNNAQYFKGIEMVGLLPILKVQFPEKWGIYPSSDEKIKIARSETTPNEWFYYTTDESVDLNMMFDLLEETVKTNLSAIAKIELLRQKVEELKELFSVESLEKLKTLTFTFVSPKKAKKHIKAQSKETKNTKENDNNTSSVLTKEELEVETNNEEIVMVER